MRRKWVIMLLAVFFAGTAVYSGYRLFQELWGQHKEAESFQELSALVYETVPPETVHETRPALQEETEAPGVPKRAAVHKRNLAPLKELNQDLFGWICISGTAVDYPVMHTPEEPQKYLHLDFNGEYSRSGVPFLDGNCGKDDTNLIIYGHNMRSGAIFHSLTEYVSESYWQEHPTIELETPEGCREFSVFAVVVTESDDPWYSFRRAVDEEEYEKNVDRAVNASLYEAGAAPAYGQQIVTLSTCYGSGQGRLMVIAGEVLP